MDRWKAALGRSTVTHSDRRECCLGNINAGRWMGVQWELVDILFMLFQFS